MTGVWHKVNIIRMGSLVGRGLGRVSPSQSTAGSGERGELPREVQGGPLPETHFWHFWATKHFWQTENAIFVHCNAQNWRICMETTSWKNVGGKNGECLWENWESWALRRSLGKPSGHSGFSGAHSLLTPLATALDLGIRIRVKLAIKVFQISPYVNDFQILKQFRKKIYFTRIYRFVYRIRITQKGKRKNSSRAIVSLYELS